VARTNWTREQLIVAFELYCRIPFGKIDHRNPEIQHIASLIGRTASAVAWKLSNFASLDPDLKARNIAGASHGSKADQQVWDEFRSDWNRLSYEAALAKESFTQSHTRSVQKLVELSLPVGRDEIRLAKSRVNQSFFRAAVLAAYDYKCCLTGLTRPELLCASHIVPWKTDQANRTNPTNGLCLNALHDRAFDRGLISVEDDFTLIMSKRLVGSRQESADYRLLESYQGLLLKTPERFAPRKDFLRFHRDNIFQR
jgi:putative restriction endonuclease